jgi:hypothetical protein
MAKITSTESLSKSETINLINAFLYAENTDHPLNLAFTIRWANLPKATGLSQSTLIRRFNSRLSKWFHKHVGEPAHYIYVNEYGSTIKLHSHFMLHVPKDHISAFLNKLPSLIPGCANHGTRFTVYVQPAADFRNELDNVTDPATILIHGNTNTLRTKVLRPHRKQRVGLLRYLLKGTDHTATCRIAQSKYNVAELFGIDHRGTQGTIKNCRRYGISHSLSKSARAKANWHDLTNVLNLRDAIDTGQQGTKETHE